MKTLSRPFAGRTLHAFVRMVSGRGLTVALCILVVAGSGGDLAVCLSPRAAAPPVGVLPHEEW